MSLSLRELNLINKIGECMSEYKDILYEDGPTYHANSDIARDGDINDFSHAVHIMQRMVMARCAQRMYPDFFIRRPAPVI